MGQPTGPGIYCKKLPAGNYRKAGWAVHVCRDTHRQYHRHLDIGEGALRHGQLHDAYQYHGLSLRCRFYRLPVPKTKKRLTMNACLSLSPLSGGTEINQPFLRSYPPFATTICTTFCHQNSFSCNGCMRLLSAEVPQGRRRMNLFSIDTPTRLSDYAPIHVLFLTECY